jgi:hypothetical protein
MTNPNDKVDGSDNMDRSGLTKREYFATAALQGIISFPGTIFGKADRSPEEMAELAVLTADRLIKKLNE